MTQVDTLFACILPVCQLRYTEVKWPFYGPIATKCEYRIETLACLTPELMFFTTKPSGSLIGIEKQHFVQIYYIWV